MKRVLSIPMILMTLILSLLPVSLAAEKTNSTCIVTLHIQPKQTKEHNQQPDQDGQRAPSRPIIVYFSTSDGVYSSYFEMEEVISYSIVDNTGQLIFSTTDATDFINYLQLCQGAIGIQIELDEYILKGWIQL